MEIKNLLTSFPTIQDALYTGFVALYLSIPVIGLIRLCLRRSKEKELLTTLRKVAGEYEFHEILRKYNLRLSGRLEKEPIFSEFFDYAEHSPILDDIKGKEYAEVNVPTTSMSDYEWYECNWMLAKTGIHRLMESLRAPGVDSNTVRLFKLLYLDAIERYRSERRLREDYSIDREARSASLRVLEQKASSIATIAKEYMDIKHFDLAARLYAAQGRWFQHIDALEEAGQAFDNAAKALTLYNLRGKFWSSFDFGMNLTERDKRIASEKIVQYLRKTAQLFRDSGLSDKAAEASYRIHKLTGRARGWRYALFWGRCLGYGERPTAVLQTMLSVIGGFGFAYFMLSCFSKENGLKVSTVYLGESTPMTEILVRSLYFSIVTATTLGYGDITPVGVSTLLSSFEVLLGIFLTTMFTVSFARKML